MTKTIKDGRLEQGWGDFSHGLVRKVGDVDYRISYFSGKIDSARVMAS